MPERTEAPLAQGAAFAAKARAAGRHPRRATPTWPAGSSAGCPLEDAARATDVALVDLPADGVLPAYEVWRQRIQDLWIKELVTI